MNGGGLLDPDVVVALVDVLDDFLKEDMKSSISMSLGSLAVAGAGEGTEGGV